MSVFLGVADDDEVKPGQDMRSVSSMSEIIVDLSTPRGLNHTLSASIEMFDKMVDDNEEAPNHPGKVENGTPQTEYCDCERPEKTRCYNICHTDLSSVFETIDTDGNGVLSANGASLFY